MNSINKTVKQRLLFAGRFLNIAMLFLLVVPVVWLIRSLLHWSEDGEAVTIVGEWLFLQNNSVASAFDAASAIQVIVFILILTPLYHKNWFRLILILAMLSYPLISWILYFMRFTPGA